MVDTVTSILPNKIGQTTSVKEDSAFPTGFLDRFCEAFSDAIGSMTGCRAAAGVEDIHQVTADSIGRKAGDFSLGAVLDVDGLENAACASLQADLIFHIVDLMMGGDPETNEDCVPREPSALDRECAALLGNTVAAAFAETLTAALDKAGSVTASCSRVEHDMDKITIASRKSEVFSVAINVTLGRTGRSGSLEFHIGLKTLDEIFLGALNNSELRTSPTNPWFLHMKETVLDMELDMLAILHVEEMNVAALSRMDVGNLIPFPEGAVNSTRLILNGNDKLLSAEVLTEGELGASLGRRAIRLSAPPYPKFLKPLENLLAVDAAIVT